MTYRRHDPQPISAGPSILLTLLMLAVLPASGRAQAGLTPAEVEAAVSRVRAEFVAVTEALDGWELREKEYYDAGGGGTVSTWRDDTGVRKMAVTFDGDGASGLREYFLSDGTLFFVFDRWETFQMWPDQPSDEYGATENRFYMPDGMIVRWLRSAFDEEGGQRAMAPDHEQWSSWQASLPEDAELWLRFADSDEQDFEAFRERVG